MNPLHVKYLTSFLFPPHAAARAVSHKPHESLRWKLQQHAQASVQRMAKLQRQLQGPHREDISAVIIQRGTYYFF